MFTQAVYGSTYQTVSLGGAGGILGFVMGLVMAFAVVGLVVWVLVVVGMWRTFSKMGLKGWYSLIPVYDVYVMARTVTGSDNYANLWLRSLVALVIVDILSPILGSPTILVFISQLVAIWLVVLNIWTLLSVSRSFGHGLGFVCGLLFLPCIFWPVLGCGSSEFIDADWRNGLAGKCLVGDSLSHVVEFDGLEANHRYVIHVQPVLVVGLGDMAQQVKVLTGKTYGFTPQGPDGRFLVDMPVLESPAEALKGHTGQARMVWMGEPAKSEEPANEEITFVPGTSTRSDVYMHI